MTNGKKIKKDNRCLSTAGLKSFRLNVKGKHSAGREVQCQAVQ